MDECRCRKPLKKVTNKTVREAVLDVFIQHKGEPTIEDIIKAMEDYFGSHSYGCVEDPFNYD